MILAYSMSCRKPETRESMTYTILGPVSLDTSLIGTPERPFEEYRVRIEKISNDIFVPVRLQNNVYAIGTFTGLKVLENDKLHIVGGAPDYFTETLRKLRKGKDYELAFYARQLDFLPDTVFVSFRYYLDSLVRKAKYIEVKYTSYRPLSR